MKPLKIIVTALVAAYLLVCGALYYMQKSMIFAAQYAQKVPENWQPSAGDTALQAKINGNCGQLHVAYWKIKNAKGSIMMHHGNGESVASINDYAYAFHALGYNLMTWDYPGYGQSTDCWFSQTELLEDAERAYQWLAAQEKPENIVIFGYSLGTSIAVYTASKHPQHPVYLVAAYDSLLNVAKNRMPRLIPVGLILRYPLPAAQWVNKIKGQVHMMHGLNDTLIDPARAQALFTQANSPVNNTADIEFVKNAGHASDDLFVYRNAWMQRHLAKDNAQIGPKS